MQDGRNDLLVLLLGNNRRVFTRRNFLHFTFCCYTSELVPLDIVSGSWVLPKARVCVRHGCDWWVCRLLTTRPRFRAQPRQYEHP